MQTVSARVVRRRWGPALGLILTVGVLGASVAAAMFDLTFSFDDNPIGAPPPGFFIAVSRQTSPGTWEVRGNGAQRHLVHVADPTVALRGLTVAGVSAAAPADVSVSSRIRFIDGDRAAGLVWRYRDAANFYAVGVNLSGKQSTLFRVTGGNRILLDQVSDLSLDGEAWHHVGVSQVGDQMRVHLDGIGILYARDRTLLEAGRAGVWSAGNSTSWFDDIRVGAEEDTR